MKRPKSQFAEVGQASARRNDRPTATQPGGAFNVRDDSFPRLTLNDGRSIPQLGLGVYKVPDAMAADTVQVALETGYRHVDTADLYENEVGVGQGIARSSLAREEIFVTTKVWNDQHGYDDTLRAFDDSLGKLALDYVELYLIHWFEPRQDRCIDTYHAREAARRRTGSLDRSVEFPHPPP